MKRKILCALLTAGMLCSSMIAYAEEPLTEQEEQVTAESPSPVAEVEESKESEVNATPEKIEESAEEKGIPDAVPDIEPEASVIPEVSVTPEPSIVPDEMELSDELKVNTDEIQEDEIEDELLEAGITAGGSTRETAVEISLNEDYVVNFNQENTEKWYKFTTKNGQGNYLLYGKNISINEQISISLYDALDEKLYESNYLRLETECNFSDQLEPNQTYYVKVCPAYNRVSTGNFRFQISYIEDLEGNTRETAYVLTEKQVYNATAVAGDIDYYKFTTEKAGHYEIKLYNDNITTMEGKLENVYGEKVKDILEAVYSKKGKSTAINLLLEENTVYYIYVKSSYLESEVGNYQISYEYKADNEGDTEAEAYVLGENILYETDFCVDEDVDYYKLVPKYSGRYLIKIVNKDVDESIEYKLISAQGEELKKSFIKKGKSETVSYDMKTGNIYYLYMKGNNGVLGAGTATGNYSVSYCKDFPFTDVPMIEGNWQYEAVKDVYEKDIMTGKSETLFNPKDCLTRAEFAVVLYRMEGSPYVSYQNIFSDVPDGKWYSKAIIWAYKEGIVSGYSDGRYGIKDNITREQIARMLYQYSDFKGNNVSMRAELGKFPDSGQVSGWAKPYVQWAVAKNMLSGKTVNGQLGLVPRGQATRAECASMISRFLKNP